MASKFSLAYVDAQRRAVIAVDEHGCVLTAAPVAIVNVEEHPWFARWITEQPCPWNDGVTPHGCPNWQRKGADE